MFTGESSKSISLNTGENEIRLKYFIKILDTIVYPVLTNIIISYCTIKQEWTLTSEKSMYIQDCIVMNGRIICFYENYSNKNLYVDTDNNVCMSPTLSASVLKICYDDRNIYVICRYSVTIIRINKKSCHLLSIRKNDIDITNKILPKIINIKNNIIYISDETYDSDTKCEIKVEYDCCVETYFLININIYYNYLTGKTYIGTTLLRFTKAYSPYFINSMYVNSHNKITVSITNGRTRYIKKIKLHGNENTTCFKSPMNTKIIYEDDFGIFWFSPGKNKKGELILIYYDKSTDLCYECELHDYKCIFMDGKFMILQKDYKIFVYEKN